MSSTGKIRRTPTAERVSSFRVHKDATGQQGSATTEKSDEYPPPRGCGRMSLSSFSVRPEDVTDGKSQYPPPSRCRMSLSSFRVHQDATGPQNSASTEKSDEHPPPSGLSSSRALDATGYQSNASSEEGVVVIVPRAQRRDRTSE
ncbi:hypothetical protein TNCV_1998901 [Trichonephila clavipes]|nr:hypothetical protein TNCV_1998901 [Trichonephila clavipes]